MLDQLTVENWLKYVNQTFQAKVSEDTVLELELIEASGMGKKPKNRRQPYSLLFRGPAEPLVEQCVVELQQEKMGKMDLFLVPVGPVGPVGENEEGGGGAADDTPEHMYYEAVFT